MFVSLALAGTIAATAPLRHLVYTFHVAAQSSTSSGAQNYDGRIAVDVAGVATDGGLVVSVTQNVPSDPSKILASTQVEIYGDGRVSVPSGQQLGTYEAEVVRLLGRGFVDASKMDANNHWQLNSSTPGSSIVDDLTVAKNDNGVMTIVESRDINSKAAGIHTDGQITYDINKNVPTAIHQVSVVDPLHHGATVTVDYTLSADSFGAKSG